MVSKSLFFNYSVRINGIWGNNFRCDTKIIKLYEHIGRNNSISLASLLSIVKDKLLELQVKPGTSITITEDPVEIENGIEIFVPFNEKILFNGSVSKTGKII